jgi:diguanylate cyclase (GGDEF)-like protein
LTLLPNRRHLESHLHDIWELAKRNSVSVGIIMCDIDYFKKINDHHGHLAGDIVLKEVAHAIKLSLKRSSDFIARYGGEEFIIVLYDADVSAAEGLCVNIQNNIKTMNHEGCPNLQLDSITLSFGIGCGIPAEASQYNDLVDLADRALYKAKESGRNRFVTFVN